MKPAVQLGASKKGDGINDDKTKNHEAKRNQKWRHNIKHDFSNDQRVNEDN